MIPSRRVRKFLQKCKQSGRVDLIKAFAEVSDLLANFSALARAILREQWRDHALKGDKKGTRELHVGFDELLVYSVHEEEDIIELLDVVTHEELRKRWR